MAPWRCAIRAAANRKRAKSSGSNVWNTPFTATKAPAIVTYGRLSAEAVKACDALAKKGIPALVVALNQIHPLPAGALEIFKEKQNVFFFEEGLRTGGVGEQTALRLLEGGFGGQFRLTAVPDCFVAQASAKEQLRKYGLDADSMIQTISNITETHQ